MSQYFAIINSTDRVQLFTWDANSFRGNPELHIATDDLAYIRGLLKHITSISIVDENDNEAASFTEYDSFSSITYLGRNYSQQLNNFANELVVTLTKIDLIEQVKRIDEKVNPIIDFEGMTLEELKEYKIKEFSKRGEEIIFTGTDVVLTDGSIKNFTYNLEDQSNLLNALFIIDKLDDLTVTLPYHGHGEPCELYGALDILLVYFTLQFYSTRMQTYVNMLNSWVRDCETKEEAEAIEFTSDLPQEYVERMEAIMGPTMALAEQLRRKYFPEYTEENTEGAL